MTSDRAWGSWARDADLIGLPYRIAVGKKSLAEGMVELKPRPAPQAELVKLGEVAVVLALAARSGTWS